MVSRVLSFVALAASACGGDPPVTHGGGGGSSTTVAGSGTTVLAAGTSSGLADGGSSSSTGEPSPCTEIYEGSLELHGQAAVDAMASLREVTEYLTITGEVSSLASLACLERVGESVVIADTMGLSDLSGLSALSFVGRGLTVRDNRDLVTLEGLDSLSFVQHVSLSGNALQTLGLNQLQATEKLTIGGCVDGPSGEVMLEDLDGLEALAAAPSFEIYGCPNLVALSGLEAFAARGGSVISLRFWFDEQLDPGLVQAVGADLEAVVVETCGDLGEDPGRCFCPGGS